MDMISEMPAWLWALSETSEVLCTDSSDLETVCLAMLSSGKISCGCRALSSTGVICSSFLKAPQAGKGFDEVLELMVISVRLASPSGLNLEF